MTSPIRFPGESTAYRDARDRLLAREIDLRRATEAVAAARRALPAGGVAPEDYVFQGRRADGAIGSVRLSELFEGKPSLAVYSFMFPRAASDERPAPRKGRTAQLALHDGPCASCTALLDQLDGSAFHVAPRVPLVVVARAPIDRLLAFGEERGWRHLRLLSAAANSYPRDYFAETNDGTPMPILNVFQRDPRGEIRHFWGSELLYAAPDPDQDPRHVGTLEPSWNLFDMTREGRAVDWDEHFDYACCHHDARD